MQVKPSVAIIVALELEARAIKRAVGDLAGVVVLTSGVGEERAYRAALAAGREQPSALISAGLAGALAPELEVGEIVVSPKITLRLDASWSCLAGAIACRDEVIRDTDGKRQLADETGALVVDMESAGVARAANELGIPFLWVKAISDRVESVLPLEIGASIGRDGQPRAGALLLRALRKPSLIRALWSLRGDSERAAKSLAAFLRQLLIEKPFEETG